MAAPLNVTLIGLGALGILYAEQLSAHPELCTLTCLADKKRQERYQKNGIWSNGKRLNLTFADPAETPKEPADLILVCVKGTTLAQAIADIAHHTGPNSIIVSLLNGITSEEKLEEAYPEAKVLRCVAQGMDAVRQNQSLAFHAKGVLILGIPKSRPDLEPALETVLSFLEKAGIAAQKDADIERRLYAKWMLNVGLNQTITVFKGTYGTVQREGRARETCLEAMREAMRIANAEGIPLDESDYAAYVSLLDNLYADGMPSMRQDALAGRPTELELFAGTVLAKGRKLGIATPVNEWLYKEISSMEKEGAC